MSFDADRLYELLPTVYRLRDAPGPGGGTGALRALLDVIAGQMAVLEEDIAQLNDDQFIETAAEWVAPYIGDLIGYRTLYGLTDKVGSPRAEVANTIAYRRRKGTASMLEQVARDVSGWDARAVEFFGLLATTQYMNHVRPRNVAWAAVRSHGTMADLGTPFETTTHTADVRRIARGRGRYNIPNVGIFAWRIRDYELAGSPAVKFNGNNADRRYLFSPLGANAPLFNHAATEDEITHLADRANVPQPITRRELWDDAAAFYPASLSVSFAGRALPVDSISACDLSDVGSGWGYAATDKVLIDPVLGRLSLPNSLLVDGQSVTMTKPSVTFHYGFPAQMGGGPYDRLGTFDRDIAPVVTVTSPATIGAAIGGLAGSGAVEILGNGRFPETPVITAGKGVRIEVRAAEGSRPTVILGGELVIDLADDAEVTLNGLLLVGAAIRIPASAGAGRLRIRHCTLVPGRGVNLDGTPAQPTAASLIVESGSVAVDIDHSIVGGLRVHEDATVGVVASIVDATDPTNVAYAALDGIAAGGELEVLQSTIVGKVHARILRLVSNSILDARLGEADTWPYPVDADRRQDGCLRFSYVPPASRTPRRYRCLPATNEDAMRFQPEFTSERYGQPAYGQLSGRCAIEIRTGADDESEMGAFHDLFDPQRDTNVRVRLDEYLRFGLEAGLVHRS